MTQPPNPIMQGFRAVRCDPAVFLLEILWRWSFAATAALVFFCAALLLLDRVHTDSLVRAVESKDPRMIGTSLLFTWLLLGVKAIDAVIAVRLVIALVWILLCAPSRRIIVRRLRPDVPALASRVMFALQGVRALAAWSACLLVIGAVAAAIHFATRGSRSDLVVFYSWAAPSIVLIGIFWLTLNWYLSVAAVLGREGQSFREALRHARQIVRRQRSDFAGTAFVFLFLRVLLLAAVLSLCGLASGMAANSPEGYTALVLVLALAFFVVSDLFYVARMASYLALAAADDQAAATQSPSSFEPIKTVRPSRPDWDATAGQSEEQPGDALWKSSRKPPPG